MTNSDFEKSYSHYLLRDMGELTMKKNIINHIYLKWHKRKKHIEENHMMPNIVRQLSIIIHFLNNMKEFTHPFSQYSTQITQRIHAGEKPSKCSNCGQDFGQSSFFYTPENSY